MQVRVINLILASGKGSRLHPISTEERPKQFLNLISDKMMLEETRDRYARFVQDAYAVTLSKYEPYLRGVEGVKTVYEEVRKESATSVFEALKEIRRQHPMEKLIILQTPSDHYIEEKRAEFETVIKRALFFASGGWISAVGVKPEHPTDEYGYIKPGAWMVEKPDISLARELVKMEYSWNTAIYAYPLEDMLFYYHEYFEGQEDSFERVILPRVASRIKVIEGNFEWWDVGTLDELKRFRLVKQAEEFERG